MKRLLVEVVPRDHKLRKFSHYILKISKFKWHTVLIICRYQNFCTFPHNIKLCLIINTTSKIIPVWNLDLRKSWVKLLQYCTNTRADPTRFGLPCTITVSLEQYGLSTSLGVLYKFPQIMTRDYVIRLK